MVREGLSDIQAFTETDFISSLSRTLAAANGFIIQQMHERGMKGLVPSHGDILMVLFAQKTLTMQALAGRINRDPSTVTALVKKLVREGYVETSKSEADHRVTEVRLSAQGKALKKDFESISTSLVQTQMQGVKLKDFGITCKTLNHIRENFVQASREGRGEQ